LDGSDTSTSRKRIGQLSGIGLSVFEISDDDPTHASRRPEAGSRTD
jgi:hypothetical protein